MTKDLPPGLTKVQQLIMKKAEKDNVERVQKATAMRGRNLRVGGLIAATVFGIYGYTMWAMKQEHILDDLDDLVKQEPSTPAKS